MASARRPVGRNGTHAIGKPELVHESGRARQRGRIKRFCGLQEPLWLCPIEIRRGVDSSRDGMLEGILLGSASPREPGRLSGALNRICSGVCSVHRHFWSAATRSDRLAHRAEIAVVGSAVVSGSKHVLPVTGVALTDRIGANVILNDRKDARSASGA
jgi:hypothetical protein